MAQYPPRDKEKQFDEYLPKARLKRDLKERFNDMLLELLKCDADDSFEAFSGDLIWDDALYIEKLFEPFVDIIQTEISYDSANTFGFDTDRWMCIRAKKRPKEDWPTIGEMIIKDLKRIFKK